MRRLSPRVVLAAGWLVAFVYGYPGRLPRASVELFQRAHASHPPVFSFVWHLLEYVVAGPAGMLVAQVTLAVAGAYAILKAALPDERAAWLTSLVMVCPPVLATVTIISPAALAGALMLFAAGGLMPVPQPAATRPWIPIGALALAAAVHPAAIVAALPLVLLREPPARAVIAWLAIGVVAVGANAALTHHLMHVHVHASVLGAPLTIDPATASDDVLLKLGVPTERSHLQDAITFVLDLVPVLYAPWLWLAAALGVVWLRRDRSALPLIIAGIAFAGALAVTGPDVALPLYAFVLVTLLRGRS